MGVETGEGLIACLTPESFSYHRVTMFWLGVGDIGIPFCASYGPRLQLNSGNPAAVLFFLPQVLAYEANIEAAVLAQDAGEIPLPEDYTQFIPKVHDLEDTSCLLSSDGRLP